MQPYDSPLAARLYDMQHEGDPDLADERDFLLSEALGAEGPVLDLGCGTGRILLPALEQGIDIAGCDRSQAVLDLLSAKARDKGLRPSVWRADLTGPGCADGSVALAFAAFRTLDHLIEEAGAERFLQAIFAGLRPGGRLLLNVANPHPLDLQEAAGERVLMRSDLRDPESGCDVIWWGTSRYEPDTFLLHEVHEYDFIEPDGRVRERYVFPFAMRWYPADDLRDIIDRVGFLVEDCWSGFHREPFEIGSGDALWNLRKPD